VERSEITPELAAGLVADQFPEWADLPVRPVELGGWDNVTFRLGDGMSVRLPSGEDYVPQVGKEHRWLPVLAPQLPLPIPVPLAQGVPGRGYPWPWSVCRWLAGEPAELAVVADMEKFAVDLAEFLAALYRIDATGGPRAGYDTCYFGVPLQHWDAQTREAIRALGNQIDARRAAQVWNAALSSVWTGPDIWFHGDVSPANLLVSDGRLSAVIDFGIAGVGDPACDTAIAWTFFSGDSRRAYRSLLPADDGTWARGRGWALWKALITAVQAGRKRPQERARSMAVIDAVLSE
jgi:aminoglycoside phosphotransferase (APT) family kinase protein